MTGFQVVLDARNEFEGVLAGFRDCDNFKENRRFQDSLDRYHRVIASEFAYDVDGFIEFFFTKTRRNGEFHILDWYRDKFLKPLQRFARQSEIASWLGDYIRSFKDEENLKSELKFVEKSLYLMIENSEKKREKEFKAKLDDIKAKIKECLHIRKISYELLCERFGEEAVSDAVVSREKYISEERCKLAQVIQGERVESEVDIENPILREVYSRKYGLVVCSGNFFGKSFIVAVVSIWALICHTDMIIKSIVAKNERELQIKNDLLNCANLMDGIVLENGIDTGIFHYLFRSNVREVYKSDIYNTNYKESASKYSAKWRWYTAYARDASDTKGQRNQNLFMVFDEASEIPSETITGAITNVNRDLNSFNFIIMSGNPNIRQGEAINEYFKFLTHPLKYKHFFDIFSLDSKDIDTKILKSNASIDYFWKTEGVESPVFRERVLGEIVNNDAILTRSDLDRIFRKESEPVNYKELIHERSLDVSYRLNNWVADKNIILSIDVAGGGADGFGICLRSKDGVCFVCRLYKNFEVYNLVSNVYKSVRNFGSSIKIVIEINGGGRYFADALSHNCSIPDSVFFKFYGHGVYEFATNEEKGGCRDNYAIFTLRFLEWSKKNKLFMNEDLKAELSGICWTQSENAKMKIDKAKFVKMFKKSPDLFDALVYSFAIDPKPRKEINVKQSTNSFLKLGIV